MAGSNKRVTASSSPAVAGERLGHVGWLSVGRGHGGRLLPGKRFLPHRDKLTVRQKR